MPLITRAVAATVVLMATIGAGALISFNLYVSQLGLVGPPSLPTTPDDWSRVVIDAGPNLQNVTSLAASPNGLLAVVGVDDGPDEFFVSTDGHSWTRVPPDQRPALGNQGSAVVGTDRGFLLVERDVWFSADGFDWQRLASFTQDPDVGPGEVLSLAVGGPGYVAVGNGGPWYSVDGSDWTLAQAPPPPTQFFASQGFAAPEVSMRGIAVHGRRLVAWGTASRHTEDSGLTSPVMWASDDGRTWTDVLAPSDGEGPAAMAAGRGGFVAADSDSGQVVVRVSADGDAWKQVDVLGTARTRDADGQVIELGVSSIAASDAGFVAAGQVGPPCLLGPCQPLDALIWTSADGRSWSRLPSDERFARAGASAVVAWRSHFVVGGEYDGKPAIWISDPR